MILCLILTVLFACLITTLIFTVKSNLRLQKEAETSNAAFRQVQSELNHLQQMYIEVVKTSAWLRGLHVGCKPEAKENYPIRSKRGQTPKEDKQG